MTRHYRTTLFAVFLLVGIGLSAFGAPQAAHVGHQVLVWTIVVGLLVTLGTL